MPKIAVCSWSLKPCSWTDLIDKIGLCGLSKMQLSLDPIASGRWNIDETTGQSKDSRVRICSGMMETVGEDYSSLESIKRTGGIRPDEYWGANQSRARNHAAVADHLGLNLVTFHAGFIPCEKTLEYQSVVDRIKVIADIFGEYEIRIGLETGQERAESLHDLLDHPGLSHVGINFDPANMILYGMGDPSAALNMLKDRIIQVHMKDAVSADVHGTWGIETPIGQGEVDWDRFFETLGTLSGDINVVIEREGGDQRVKDIIEACKIAKAYGYEL